MVAWCALGKAFAGAKPTGGRLLLLLARRKAEQEADRSEGQWRTSDEGVSGRREGPRPATTRYRPAVLFQYEKHQPRVTSACHLAPRAISDPPARALPPPAAPTLNAHRHRRSIHRPSFPWDWRLTPRGPRPLEAIRGNTSPQRAAQRRRCRLLAIQRRWLWKRGAPSGRWLRSPRRLSLDMLRPQRGSVAARDLVPHPLKHEAVVGYSPRVVAALNRVRTLDGRLERALASLLSIVLAVLEDAAEGPWALRPSTGGASEAGLGLSLLSSQTPLSHGHGHGRLPFEARRVGTLQPRGIGGCGEGRSEAVAKWRWKTNKGGGGVGGVGGWGGVRRHTLMIFSRS